MSIPDFVDNLHVEPYLIDSFGFSSYGIRGKQYHTGYETPESPGSPITPHKEFSYSNITDEMASKLERIGKAYDSIEDFEKNKDLENDAENVGTMVARMKWYKVYRTKYENIKVFGYFWMILSDIIKIQAMLINQRQPREISVFIEEVFIKGYLVLAYECWGERMFQEIGMANSKLNIFDEIEKSEIFIDMYKEIAAIVSFINIMTTIYVSTNGVNPRTITFFEQIPKGADLTSIMNQCRELIMIEDIFEMENELNQMAYYLKHLKRRLAEIAEMNNVDVENKSEYLKALEKSYNWTAVFENDANATNSYNNTNDGNSFIKRKNPELRKYYYEMYDREALMDLLNELKEEMRREELKTKRINDLNKLKKFKESKIK
ncbi:12723_t:CDS:1 [Cetraspora pellucida]|uniref:12723_t:CDS:1 n=1 Tax=Cetraspora pellucida TaxID=1433469 RepID=A0A9N8ZL61_9GLOM|nr:12723_t:CDS:1 [Cetraspora pellucida]